MAKEITQSLVWELLPQRRADSHKGTYGKLLAVCGSIPSRGSLCLILSGGILRLILSRGILRLILY